MKKKYLLKFPRGIEIDICNVPEDFEAMIHKAFGEYTYGTAKEYTFHDKLAFIDLCRQYAHNARDIDAEDEVNKLVKEYFAYNLDEYGQLTDESEYLSIEFMEHCYAKGVEKGTRDLYSHYGDDHHIYDRVMELLYRAIKAVIDWTPDGRCE